ncbi:MAG: hypothetical protein SOZ58_07080 [Prevotella sp.]|nr:hypothetical protein [Prevotella sp.]
MKKTTFLFVLGTAFCLSSSLISCGDDDPVDPIVNPDPINPQEPSKDEAMTSLEQKEYLDVIAKEFMNQTPASDFQNIANLYNYISDTYTDNYDWDAVGEWASNIFDLLKESLGTTNKEQDKYTWGEYNEIYTNYKAVLMASNFTGHFTANNNKWTLSKADDLQFIFKDQNGKECVLKLETSGNVKKMYVCNVDDWVNYDYSNDNDYYISNEYYDRTQLTIGVPENVVVTLTQGGTQVVKTTVKVNLGSISNERFDLSKNELTATTLVELNNGYKFNVSQVAYSGNSKASANFEISKNGKSLATVAFSSDLSGIPSCNVDAFTSDGIYDINFDNANMKNAFVKLDILGKLQIQGKVSDIRKFADYVDNAYDNDDDEKNFKSYITQANSLLDINLFYDGKAVKQANVKIEPFVDGTWNGITYWYCEPVLYFYDDNTSYSTFEAFFNDEDFKSVIDTFKGLADKYAALIKESIDW